MNLWIFHTVSEDTRNQHVLFGFSLFTERRNTLETGENLNDGLRGQVVLQ